MCRIINDLNKKTCFENCDIGYTVHVIIIVLSIRVLIIALTYRCRYWVEIDTMSSCVSNLLEKLEHFIFFGFQYSNLCKFMQTRLSCSLQKLVKRLPWGEKS